LYLFASRDGYHQQIGGCLKDFRNKPFPVRAKIEYYKKALTVSIMPYIYCYFAARIFVPLPSISHRRHSVFGLLVCPYHVPKVWWWWHWRHSCWSWYY